MNFIVLLSVILSVNIVGTFSRQAVGNSRIKRQDDFPECPDGETEYENDKGEYYCDCESGKIYDPKRDRCYNLYLRGPCKTGEYLIMKSENLECVPNPCGKVDRIVQYNGTCHRLYTPGGPCPLPKDGGGILSVDIKTFQLGCHKTDDSLSILDKIPSREKSSRFEYLKKQAEDKKKQTVAEC